MSSCILARCYVSCGYLLPDWATLWSSCRCLVVDRLFLEPESVKAVRSRSMYGSRLVVDVADFADGPSIGANVVSFTDWPPVVMDYVSFAVWPSILW